MNVVDFDKCIKKKERHKMCQNVVDEIVKNREENKKVYLVSDMEEVTKKILYETGNENTIVVPVVNIAKRMQFDTFQKRLRRSLSGFIGINKRYEKKYKTDHVICTNIKVHPYQQRFVISHELAHFLFDYNHKSGLYYNTYRKNHHDKESERRANTFAANLLMPRETFLREYNKAKLINPDPIYLVIYLSDLFKAPRKAVLKRINEVRG